MSHKSKAMKISHFERCEICGEYRACEIHHVFGGTARQISDKYGAVASVCRSCHNKIHHRPSEYAWLKSQTQKRVMEEQEWDMEEWMKHFYKSYMED